MRLVFITSSLLLLVGLVAYVEAELNNIQRAAEATPRIFLVRTTTTTTTSTSTSTTTCTVYTSSTCSGRRRRGIFNEIEEKPTVNSISPSNVERLFNLLTILFTHFNHIVLYNFKYVIQCPGY